MEAKEIFIEFMTKWLKRNKKNINYDMKFIPGVVPEKQFSQIVKDMKECGLSTSLWLLYEVSEWGMKDENNNGKLLKNILVEAIDIDNMDIVKIKDKFIKIDYYNEEISFVEKVKTECYKWTEI